MHSSQIIWRAEFEGSILHISGVEKYPDRFSTAGLERVREDKLTDFIVLPKF
jgi:hypothetical protein